MTESTPPMDVFLANLVYQAPSKRRAIINESEYKNELTLHNDLNLDHFASVTHQPSQTLYNLHRGTTNFFDVQTDLDLAFGNLAQTTRFRSSEKLSQWGVYEHGDDKKIVELGHSLGGALAEEIALKHNRHSVALNMGTTPFKSYKSVDRSKHKHYRTTGDPISMFDPRAKNRFKKRPSVHDRLWNRAYHLGPYGNHWANIAQNALESHKLSSFSQ